MPLLPEINLDDRRFDDLVAEAKRRIPGYAPGWTDHNDSDPGIAIVQLFAWMSEMILYRLNKVPEKNYQKFLELLGVDSHPATPARTDLTFTLTKDAPEEGVEIPANTRVSLAAAVEGGPVVFETNVTLRAVSAQIKTLATISSSGRVEHQGGSSGSGKGFLPFGAEAGPNEIFELGLDRPLPAGQEVTLTVHVFTGDLIAEGKGIRADTPPSALADEDEVPTRDPVAVERLSPAVFNWTWSPASPPAAALDFQPLNVLEDTTAGFTRSGTVRFVAPDLAKPTGFTPGDDPFLLLRVEIVQSIGSGYDLPPQLEDVLLNTVAATQASTIPDELLGASNGRPNQTFRLSTTPVLADTVELVVDEGDLAGRQPWERVQKLTDAGRDRRVFTVDSGTGEIRFGDGAHGMIPPVFADRDGIAYDNIRVVSYQSGGGKRGNTGAGTITNLESRPQYVDSVKNLSPADGGEDTESIDDLKQRAPEKIRSRSRAVTIGDFEYLARTTPGARIRRARALPLHNPSREPARRPNSPGEQPVPLTSLPAPGAITVIVVPEALPEQRKPVPNEQTLQLVGRWLNQHKLVTAEVYVVAPVFRSVSVRATVKTKKTASVGVVRRKLNEALLEYFDPIRGGREEGGKGDGWPFGGTIFFSGIIRRMFAVEGVETIPTGEVKIFVDNEEAAGCHDILLADNELTFSVEHHFDVT